MARKRLRERGRGRGRGRGRETVQNQNVSLQYWGGDITRKPALVYGFAHPSAAPRLAREGGRAARSPLVETRREAVRVGARPPSRAFWKRLEGRWSRERGGATGRAPRGEGRSPALQKADTREAPSSSAALLLDSALLVLQLPFSLWSGSPLCPLLLGAALSLSPSLGPALVVRRAACWWRRGQEAQQCRLSGGPARPDEGCRRGFAGRVGGRNQARPR